MTRPNILFITSHDLGRHLGSYGWDSVPSPNLDRFAADGVRFENSFCTAPQCSPSRAALHTGRHAHSVGVLGLAHSPFSWRLQPQYLHLARRLQESGYKTALAGAQHVTRNEALPELGFDQWSGLAPAPEVAQKTAELLAQFAGEEQPFYLEVGFFEPHRPYDWGGAVPYDAQGVELPPYIPDTPGARLDFAALQGAIARMDEAVGTILEALERQGLAENTLVLFTTDHGLAMPRAKCTLYDPGIESALMLRLPAAGVSGGRVLQPMLSHVDVVPTILEALGLPSPEDVDGRSFWPLLQGQPYEARDAIFAEKTFHTAYEPMRAIRTTTHKLIANFESGSRYDVPDDIRLSPIYPDVLPCATGERPHIELYDLAEDPDEVHNLAGQADVAEIEATLKRRLYHWMVGTNDPLLQPPLMSPFYRATLRELAG